MADQLPIIIRPPSVDVATTAPNSLIGRGLSAIQSKKTGIALTEQDVRYREVRDIYNHLVEYCYSYQSSDLNPDILTRFDESQLLQLKPLVAKFQQIAYIVTVLEQLADKSYCKAYFPLAMIYSFGQGVIKNTEKANYYEELASNWLYDNRGLEDPEIWTDYEWMRTIYVYEDDDHEEMYWCHKAADKGFVAAQNLLGFFYENEKDDYQQAMFWYRKSAEQGNAWGQYHTYWDDPFWLHMFAEQGNAEAQCSLGFMYDHNSEEWKFEAANGLVQSDIEHDCKQAIFWYRKAAEQGDFMGQFRLGQIHSNDCQCGEHFGEQAVFWLFLASRTMPGRITGSGALYNIGWIYENGKGMAQDIKQAIFWYQEAAKQGGQSAQEKLIKLGINWTVE